MKETALAVSRLERLTRCRDVVRSVLLVNGELGKEDVGAGAGMGCSRSCTQRSSLHPPWRRGRMKRAGPIWR